MTDANPPDKTPPFRLTTSSGFDQWLAAQNASIAFTTYQKGKLFLLGTTQDARLVVVDRSYPRCMGLVASVHGQMWMSSLNQMFQLQNVLPHGQLHEAHDAVFVPRRSWVTGNLDIHDVVVGSDGMPIFVNTRFNCLARLADGHSFAPLWRPDFISALVAEDRCHLNGLAAENGRPRYVTLAAQSDTRNGWRAGRVGGGSVIDVESNAVVATGLTMPHSPRLRDGQLWLLNSGEGQLGCCNPATGKFEPVAFCPGFARGLAFIGSVAVIGLSKPRRKGSFDGLPLEQSLTHRSAEAICGLIFVDLQRGGILHWVRFKGDVQELYDVVVLPGVKRPTALSFHTDEINRMISVAPTASADTI